MPLHHGHGPRPVTLAWLDADEAILVRWSPLDGAVQQPPTRLVSDVPSRHRATGGARHDPQVRAGGGSVADDRIDRRREQRIERYLRTVADQIPADDRVILLGPGAVHERLAVELRQADGRHGHSRPVETAPAQSMTERQLFALLREYAGVPAERRLPTSAPAGPARAG